MLVKCQKLDFMANLHQIKEISMSGNSNSSSEDVGGVVMLALLGAFLWWFFSSSMEDITEDFLEACF